MIILLIITCSNHDDDEDDEEEDDDSFSTGHVKTSDTGYYTVLFFHPSEIFVGFLWSGGLTPSLCGEVKPVII